MAQTVVPWIPLWAYEAWVARGVDWLAMSEDLPRDGQPRHGRRRTAASGCDYRPNNLAAHERLVAEMKRMLRRLGFWVVVAHSHTAKEHDPPVRHALLRHRSAHVGARSVLPHARRREPVRRRRVVLPLVGAAGESAALTIAAQALRVADHRSASRDCTRVSRESALVQPLGITVSDFNRR